MARVQYRKRQSCIVLINRSGLSFPIKELHIQVYCIGIADVFENERLHVLTLWAKRQGYVGLGAIAEHGQSTRNEYEQRNVWLYLARRPGNPKAANGDSE